MINCIFMKIIICGIIATEIFFTSCSMLKDSPRNAFSNGMYRIVSGHKRPVKAYVEVNEDFVKAYPVTKAAGPDSLSSYQINYPLERKDMGYQKYSFVNTSFDVDILTIACKFRPATTGFPKQLNTNFNGALYIGYRSDNYYLNYKKSGISSYKQNLTHLGYSLGIFNGVGATAMNPWVTNDAITSEYDGFIYGSGVAGIVGINNLTFGVAIGTDHLLDKNRKYWLYQSKPWIGLVLGLNLN